MHTKKSPYRHSQYKENIKSFPLRLQYQNWFVLQFLIFSLCLIHNFETNLGLFS